MCEQNLPVLKDVLDCVRTFRQRLGDAFEVAPDLAPGGKGWGDPWPYLGMLARISDDGSAGIVEAFENCLADPSSFRRDDGGGLTRAEHRLRQARGTCTRLAITVDQGYDQGDEHEGGIPGQKLPCQYVLEHPGIAGEWTREQLVAALEFLGRLDTAYRFAGDVVDAGLRLRDLPTFDQGDVRFPARHIDEVLALNDRAMQWLGRTINAADSAKRARPVAAGSGSDANRRAKAGSPTRPARSLTNPSPQGRQRGASPAQVRGRGEGDLARGKPQSAPRTSETTETGTAQRGSTSATPTLQRAEDPVDRATTTLSLATALVDSADWCQQFVSAAFGAAPDVEFAPGITWTDPAAFTAMVKEYAKNLATECDDLRKCLAQPRADDIAVQLYGLRWWAAELARLIDRGYETQPCDLVDWLLLEENIEHARKWTLDNLTDALEYLERTQEAYELALNAVDGALQIRALRGLLEDPPEITWPEDRLIDEVRVRSRQARDRLTQAISIRESMLPDP